MRFFLKRADQAHEVEVSQQEWIATERELGFTPVCPSDDPDYETIPATGGFSLGEVQGYVEYTAEEEAASVCDLSALDPGGCPCYSMPSICACVPTERVLRCYAASRPAMPLLTREQRRACLREIASVEGYDWKAYAHVPDSDLARGVLEAYVSYCRDKGLL